MLVYNLINFILLTYNRYKHTFQYNQQMIGLPILTSLGKCMSKCTNIGKKKDGFFSPFHTKLYQLEAQLNILSHTH